MMQLFLVYRDKERDYWRLTQRKTVLRKAAYSERVKYGQEEFDDPEGGDKIAVPLFNDVYHEAEMGLETDQEIIERNGFIFDNVSPDYIPFFLIEKEDMPARIMANYEDKKVTEYSSQIESSSVYTEFKRRLDQGMAVTLPDTPTRPAGNYVIQTDAQGRTNIAEATLAATIAISLSIQGGDYRWLDSSSDFTWKMSNNETPKIDAAEMQKIGIQVGIMKDKLFKKMSILKEMSPIPPNYADDKYWN